MDQNGGQPFFENSVGVIALCNSIILVDHFLAAFGRFQHFFVMALTIAFQTWMDKQDKLDQKGQETGIRKFREKVRQENGNKLIVFDEDRYAIFDTYEVFILCGRNVRKPTGVPEVVSKRDILLKHKTLIE